MFLDNLKFFKTPKSKQFSYQPRYWDEAKEDLEKRVKAAQQEAAGVSTQEYSKEALRDRMDFRAQRPNAKRPDMMSNLRILMIAGLLTLLLYFVFVYL